MSYEGQWKGPIKPENIQPAPAEEKFKELIRSIIGEFGVKIESIVTFGSNKGLSNPNLSDIDLFIVCKKRKDISEIYNKIRKLECDLLKIQHSRFFNLVQRGLLGTPDYSGVHLMIIGKDEFNKEFQPKSFRLKIVTNFIMSRSLFLYYLKENGKIIFGEDLLEDIKIEKLSLHDRWLSLFISYLILLTIPFAIFKRDYFKIWCFKAAKYPIINMKTYASITTKKSNINVDELNCETKMFNLSNEYRYIPERCDYNRLKLYFNSWADLLKNSRILWQGVIREKVDN